MPGPIDAGDDHARNAGLAEGANQNVPVFVHKESILQDDKDDYTYELHEAGFTHCALVSNRIVKVDVPGDIRVVKYRKKYGEKEGLFKKSGRVTALSVTRSAFSIGIPLTIVLGGDASVLEGTMIVDVKFDRSGSESLERARTLLETDYATVSVIGPTTTKSINPDGISRNIRNILAGAVQIQMDSFESVLF